MQFILTSTLALLATALTAVAQPPLSTTINFDDRYCNSDVALTTTACSTGSNGLASRWPTFGNVPNFPLVGGGFPVEGFNSANCGSCWEITDPNTGRSVAITLVNVATPGFTLCTDTLLALTGFNRTNVPGVVPVTARQVPLIDCGTQ
ncbi:hypothetical protein D9611_011029 [Ephemerocybe angulata]|uniref:Cerato-platanin n=1 Tax=Ephemerocybe angulata TaxID=980116 RepID=A0A8H5BBH0_9AGAR|nr:hypothetical protein D9611_011029 [Tulosesus angulatus]